MTSRSTDDKLVLVHASLLDARCFDGNLARLAYRFSDHGPSRVCRPFRTFSQSGAATGIRPMWTVH
jgi:hypothetical protein